MDMMLRQHGPQDPGLAPILTLIQTAFAYMDNVVSPPSSMHRLDHAAMQNHARNDELWSIGPPLAACAVFQVKDHALYIGKLSVAAPYLGQGLARQLVEHAALRAKALMLPVLELQTRIELTHNHAAFTAMGFREVGRTSHAGYTAPTSITFRKDLP